MEQLSDEVQCVKYRLNWNIPIIMADIFYLFTQSNKSQEFDLYTVEIKGINSFKK